LEEDAGREAIAKPGKSQPYNMYFTETFFTRPSTGMLRYAIGRGNTISFFKHILIVRGL